MGADVSALTHAAGVALAEVFGPVVVRPGEVLPSSERAVVLRASARYASGRQHDVVLKAAVGAGDGGAREQAALTLLAAHDVPGVVRLLAAGDDPPVLVLADLGTRPTLADRLLGDDPVAAQQAVLGWAAAVGALQARTASFRQAFSSELASLSPLGPPAVDTMPDALSGASAVLARELPRLGVHVSADALVELRGIGDALDVSVLGAAGALAPGDTCPSNAVETAEGIVLLDFEGAEYRHVAWEAAYLTVPWPSCWCSWALPPQVTELALARWRQAVSGALPEVLTPGFADDLVRAATGWAFISTGWFLGSAFAGDPPPSEPARRSLIPRRRALLQHRLGQVAALKSPLVPSLADLAAQTCAAMQCEWGAHPLPLAPAFR